MNQDNAKIVNFYELDAWKQGHEFVLAIYDITKQFPKDEMFGIVSQMRRAAVSITSNIAEGFSRRSPKEKMQFYSIAGGSLTELLNQLFISRDVGYLEADKFKELQEKNVRVHMILNGLIAKTQTFINS